MAGLQSTLRRIRYRYGHYKLPAQILLVFIIVASLIRFVWLYNHDAPEINVTRNHLAIDAPEFTKVTTDPSIDWSRYAYVFHADTPEYLCNALMMLSELEDLKSRAARVLIYPDTWDVNAIDEYDEAYDLTSNARLLQKAYNKYNVTLQPTESLYKAHAKQKTWTNVYVKMGAFNMTEYDRVITLDSDGVILQSLDELFLLQSTPMALPYVYWGDPLNWQLSSQIMIMEPSAMSLEQIEQAFHSASADDYAMDIISEAFSDGLIRLPQRPYNLLTGEFRRPKHTSWLRSNERWDARKALDEAKFAHFSDWPLPKPWMRADKKLLKQHTPDCKSSGWFGTDCTDKNVWLSFYWKFALRRKNICGAGFELQSPQLPSSAVLRHGKWYHLDEVTR